MLSNKQPNIIVDVRADGVEIETERSQQRGSGAQLVPAWMIQVAWDRLRRRGVLTNRELLSSADLNVKRSSEVCALLAQLSSGEVAGTRPIELRIRQ